MGFDNLNFDATVDPAPLNWPTLPVVPSGDDTGARPPATAQSARLSWAEHVVDIHIATVPAPTAEVLRIGVSVGEEQFDILIEMQAFARFGRDFSFEVDLPADVAASTAALILELGMQTLLEAVEASVGVPVRISAVSPLVTAGEGTAALVEISIDGVEPNRFLIDHMPTPASPLLSAFTPVPDRSSTIDVDRLIGLPVALFGPSVEVDPRDFADLAIGDGLVFPNDRGAVLARRLHVGGAFFADVEPSEDRFVLASALRDTRFAEPSDFRRNPAMPKIDPADPFDDSLVTVHIELARTTVKVGALRHLSSGSVLPFETALPEKVRLFVGADCFAEGELVQLEQNIAVRLTRIE